MNRRSFLKISALILSGALMPSLDIKWPLGVRTMFEIDQDAFAFTIDDGWSAEAILPFVQFCRDHGLKATWFAPGAGIKCVRDEPKILEIMSQDFWSVGYHTMHHPAVEEQKRYSRQDWNDDYDQWLEIAYETSKGWPLNVMPYARAAGGFFSDAFMGMCEDNGLTAYGWSKDPYVLVRGKEIVRGDILLTHFRVSDWKWFEHVAAHDLTPADIMTLTLMELFRETINENQRETDLPICGGDDGHPPCLYEVKTNGETLPSTNI